MTEKQIKKTTKTFTTKSSLMIEHDGCHDQFSFLEEYERSNLDVSGYEKEKDTYIEKEKERSECCTAKMVLQKLQ